METKIPVASGIEVHCAYHAIASIHDLKARPGNPNEHPESQLVLYCAAIKARGWRESVTVSKRSGFIVTGAGAVLAARMLGVDQVPVEYQDYASEEEELADVLAHNRLPELSENSPSKLQSIIAQIGGKAFTAGYTAETIAELVEKNRASLAAVLTATAAAPVVKQLPIPDPPKLAWVLIALPVVRYAEIAPQIEVLAAVEGIRLETSVSD